MVHQRRSNKGRIDAGPPPGAAGPQMGGRSCPPLPPGCASRGFTLIELLVVVGVIALLVGVLAPTLSLARAQARRTVCASNLRQMLIAAVMYANQERGALLPCSWTKGTVRSYWWGEIRGGRVDYTVSPLYKYMRSRLEEDGIYECPDQPWGTYTPQGAGAGESPTSTYGYNAYYLTPAAAPGWEALIGKRPWQRFESIPSPGQVFVFADTLLYYTMLNRVSNTALLDPPWTIQSFGTDAKPSVWRRNRMPTTVFRHRGKANAACADGHVDSYDLDGGTMEWPKYNLGSVGAKDNPHYVPDWKDW